MATEVKSRTKADAHAHAHAKRRTVSLAASWREADAFEAHVRRRSLAAKSEKCAEKYSVRSERTSLDNSWGNAGKGWDEVESIHTREVGEKEWGSESEDDEDEVEQADFDRAVAAGKVPWNGEVESEVDWENKRWRGNANAAVSLSQWVKPARSSSDTEEEQGGVQTDKNFAAAIRRWQLRKGREVTPGKPVPAATLAGVNSDGKFVPYLIRSKSNETGTKDEVFSSPLDRFAFDDEGYETLSKDEKTWETEIGDGGRVRALSLSQNRIIGRCFVKWQKYWAAKKKCRKAQFELENRSRRTIFKQWLHVYYAVRLHRIKTLFRFFQVWVEFSRQKKTSNQLMLVGDTFFEINAKQFALRSLVEHSSRKQQAGKMMALAVEKHHRVKKRKALKLWQAFGKASANQAQNCANAAVLFRKTGLQRTMNVLRKNVRNRYASIWIRRNAEQRLVLDYLAKWKAALRREQQYRLQLEGARLVFDVRLCRRAFVDWRRLVELKRVVETAKVQYISKRKVEALKSLRKFAVSKIRKRNSFILANTWRQQRGALAVFATLVENTVRVRNHLDAKILYSLHVTKHALLHWKEVARQSRNFRLAIQFEEVRKKQHGVDTLVNCLAGRKEKEAQVKISNLYFVRTTLRNMFMAWQELTLESIQLRAGEVVAESLQKFQLKRRSFLEWSRYVFRNENLALMFRGIVEERLVRSCFEAIQECTHEWKSARMELDKGKALRALSAWWNLTAEVKYLNQALRTAAMFRRSRLISKCFYAWEERHRLIKSKKEVLNMARNHAKSHVLRKSFAAWIVAVIPTFRKPLDLHGATRWHECQVLNKALLTWRKQSYLSRSLRILCRRRGVRVSGTRDIGFDGIQYRVMGLHRLSILERSFRRWSLFLNHERQSDIHTELMLFKRGLASQPTASNHQKGAWSNTDTYLAAMQGRDNL